MPNVFINGFADELLKLAVGDVQPEPEDPNHPWRANTQARGIQQAQALPSRVPTGHLGEVSQSSKSDGENDGYLKGREQTGAL